MPYNLVIIFLGMYLNELGNFSQRNNYSYIFIVALFTLFNNKKNSQTGMVRMLLIPGAWESEAGGWRVQSILSNSESLTNCF